MRPARSAVATPPDLRLSPNVEMNQARRAGLVWCGVVAGTAAVMVTGRGALCAPPLLHPALIGRWWNGRTPLVAVAAVGRELLVAVGCYLVVVATALIAARIVDGAAQGMRRWRLPMGRRLVLVLFGAAAAGPAWNITTAAPAGADPLPPGPAPVMRYLGPDWTQLHQTSSQPGSDGPDARASRGRPRHTVAPTTIQPPPLDTAQARGVPRPTTRGAWRPPFSVRRLSRAAPAERTVASAAATAASRSRHHTRPRRRAPVAAQEATDRDWPVRPGDSLWSIAARSLASAWSRDPSTRDTAVYWLSVIAANRAWLPDPEDPSLLFPGDVVRLPPIPPEPSSPSS
jgi:hypothetical protein